MERSQLVGDRRFGRLELGAFHVSAEQIERATADQLCHERPWLAGRANSVVERQLIQRRPLRQINECEKTLDRQGAVEHDPVQAGDKAPTGVDSAVADGEC
jgi:hypothetical protein